MKTNLLFIAVVATLVSACTTGTQMTRTYDDDIYFSPGDVPPVSLSSDEVPAKDSNSNAKKQGIVMSQREKNADGTSTINNYIYQPDEAVKGSGNQSYDMDHQQLAGSDTTIYANDDSVKYVINNYFDDNDNDIDFGYRINRFHRPFYYDPFFYDDWSYGYYPGYSGWGYDSWFMGGYPYGYYGGYYSPYAFGLGLGFGGYWGSGYYGGYYGGYNDWYGGYYGGGYYGGGGYYSNNTEVGRRRSIEMNMPGGTGGGNLDGALKNGSRSSSVIRDGSSGNSSDQRLPNGVSARTESSHSRARTIDPSGNNGDTKSATIVNNRREASTTRTYVQGESGRSQVVRPGSSNSAAVRRSYEPTTSGRTYDQAKVERQGQNYTPSYNKPRIVNQSNYNNNSYSRPRTSDASYDRGAVRSSNSSGQSYSAPRSSSSMRQTYQSSSSYSNGSSSSSSRSNSGSTYSNPSNSNYSSPSNSTYSAPERSSSSSPSNYSSGSSSGGSYSGGSSGGSSGGGGGGGHRR